MSQFLPISVNRIATFMKQAMVAFFIVMLPTTSVLAAAVDPGSTDLTPDTTSQLETTDPVVEEEPVVTDEPEVVVEEEQSDTTPTEPNFSQSSVSSFSTSTTGPSSNFNTQAVDPVYNQDKDQYYTTIQAAINDADPGDTITVEAGTYNEAVTINKALTLVGAGPTSIITQAGGGAGIVVSANNVTIDGFKVEMDGLDTGSGCLVTPLSSGNGLTFAGSLVSGLSLIDLTITGASNGMRVGGGTTLDGVSIVDSHFDGNCVGWYLSKETAASNPSDVTNIDVSNTSFNNNQGKGIYAEKLSQASFVGIEVIDSGVDPTYGFNAGIDINLKWMAYQDIAISNSVVTGSGLQGSASNLLFPAGVTFKARDDAPSYGPANAASLDGVTLDGVSISGGVVGVRLGEPGKNNAGPTNVNIQNSSISGTGDYDLVNQSTATVTATTNWWGTLNAAAIDVRIEKTGPVVFEPYCADSTCDTIYVEVTGGDLDGAQLAIDGTPGSAQSVEFLDDFTVNAGNSSVFIPDGTVITKTGGGNFDTTDINASLPGLLSVSGLGSNAVVDGVLQWGIPNLGLSFSKAITIRVDVGTDLNGQTLSIQRSTSGDDGWTSSGIVSPTCVVSGGICQFKATKASYYAVTHSTASSTTAGPYSPVPTFEYAAVSSQDSDSTASDADKEDTTSETTDDGDVQAAQDDGLNAWWWIAGIAGVLALLYVIQQRGFHLPKRFRKA